MDAIEADARMGSPPLDVRVHAGPAPAPEGEGLGPWWWQCLGFGNGHLVGDGDGDRDGLGGGGGSVTECCGFTVFCEKSGVGKSTTGRPANAVDMKSCQISAGIDPPNTSGKPSTLCMGISPALYPTHTQAAS